MLPLVTGHNLTTSNAHKTHDCIACIQGKFLKHNLYNSSLLNYHHLSIVFMVTFADQLMHFLAFSNIILFLLTHWEIPLKFF